MALKVAVQMDPIETINIDGDSSFALMLAAQARGHELWHYEVKHLVLREGVMKLPPRPMLSPELLIAVTTATLFDFIAIQLDPARVGGRRGSRR